MAGQARHALLKSLHNTSSHFVFWRPQADLEDASAFMAPIKGCKYVLHTASPVVMAPAKGEVSNAPVVKLLRYRERLGQSLITTFYTQLQTEIWAPWLLPALTSAPHPRSIIERASCSTSSQHHEPRPMLLHANC